MKELKFIELEEGKEYFVISEVNLDNNKYYVLVNSNNNYDIVIKKEENEFLVGLDNMEELKSVIVKLAADNKNDKEVQKVLDMLKNIIKM